jgi:hypothetical protein
MGIGASRGVDGGLYMSEEASLHRELGEPHLVPTKIIINIATEYRDHKWRREPVDYTVIVSLLRRG